MPALGPDSFKISLRIRHPDRDLAEVCAKLGRVPRPIWKAGDQRRTPKGTALPGTREASYCAIDFDEAADLRLAAHLDFIAGSLMPHRSALNEFSSSGGEMSLYISVFPSENSGETIDTSILEKLAELKISIDLDVYPSIAHDPR
jgi:hypothetical protein